MLNSTKTWQEEVIKEYCYWNGCQKEAVITTDDVRKLIKDLRKRDMEALIEMLVEKYFYDVNHLELKQLIKDYYEN